jgi:N-methylhydantoinase A
MVNIRLGAGYPAEVKMPPVTSDGAPPKPRTMRKVCLEDADRFLDCPVYARDTLSAGAEIGGPALIEEYGSTTVMFTGDRARVAETGEIIIQLRVVQ